MSERKRINPHRLFIGAFVPNWLMVRTEISPGAKLCYGRLCQHAGEDGQCFPSQETLAEELAVSPDSVNRYIKELVKHELIEAVRRGHTHSNFYYFLDHEWIHESPSCTRKLRDHEPAEMPNHEAVNLPVHEPAKMPPIRESEEKNHNKTPAASSKEAQEDSKISEDARKLTFELINFMVRENPKAKYPQKGTPERKKWELEADRLLRLDEHSKQEASEVLAWAKKDDFWSKNILSTKKFRKQYDRLFLGWRQSKGYRPSIPSATTGNGQGFLEMKRRELEFEKQRAQGANAEQSTQT